MSSNCCDRCAMCSLMPCPYSFHDDTCDGSCDPPTSVHKDMRAQSKADNRIHKQKQKYYSFRGVHPSWVGQKHYTLVLTSEQTLSCRRSKRTKRTHTTAVIETEHSIPSSRTVGIAFCYARFFACDAPTLAAAEHRSHPAAVHAEHRHEILTPEYEAVDTIEAPQSLDRIYKDWLEPLGALPRFEMLSGNTRLKLKVETWTKRDNFDDKECFWGGPDIRHHKGKRNYRERMHEKQGLGDLGRRERQLRARARDVEEQESDAVGNVAEFLYDHPYIWDRRACRTTADYDHDDDEEEDGEEEDEEDDDDETINAKANSVDEQTQPVPPHAHENVLSELASLLASSGAVVVAAVDEDTISDFDTMSDFADELVEIEWDVLSDTSSDFILVTGVDDVGEVN